MTPRRLDWALRTRGPDLAGWPAAEREAALLLLRRDAGAQARLAEALAAEDEMGEDGAAGDGVQADRAARGRMQGAVRRALAPPTAAMRGLGWLTLAACVAGGLYLGAALGAALGTPDAESPAVLGPSIQANLPATVLAGLDP